MSIIDQSLQAEILLPTDDIHAEMAFFTELGFVLNQIYPSDNPAVAVMSGMGIKIRIDKNAVCAVPRINIPADTPGKTSGAKDFTAPNGTQLCLVAKSESFETPSTVHKFEVRQLRDSDSWVIGRAGMMYRDLIPGRLGGGIIASHIRIPGGGPVPDMVHYHTIGFQLIYCYKGWVRLVYEDQGPPFVLHAGDCVTQPPEIRHRVLEASENLEVIEIGVPAEHMTTIDHELELPTADVKPDREFGGQIFCHHKLKEATWEPWRLNGFEFRDTGINKSTRGVASVHVARVLNNASQSPLSSHDTDILFAFVMEGQMELSADGHDSKSLKAGDAFVVPPNLKYQIQDFSNDLQLLEVALPGSFNTVLH